MGPGADRDDQMREVGRWPGTTCPRPTSSPSRGGTPWGRAVWSSPAAPAAARPTTTPGPSVPAAAATGSPWEDASGRATLYTWSIVHQNDLPPFNEKVPYVAAVVDLEEGPRMMTNVVGCEFDDLAVGMALQVDFEDIGDGFSIPVFRPVG